MKIIRILSIALGLIASSTLSQAQISIFLGPVTNPSNGHVYFGLSPATWDAAEAYAIGMGGHLATIRNASEDAWVFSTFNQGDPNRGLWIGFNDAAVEGTWRWSSGESFTYTHWGTGEPNNLGNEDYAVYFPSVPNSGAEVGSWNDGPSASAFRSVVEIVPEPAAGSVLLLGLLAARWQTKRKAS